MNSEIEKILTGKLESQELDESDVHDLLMDTEIFSVYSESDDEWVSYFKVSKIDDNLLGYYVIRIYDDVDLDDMDDIFFVEPITKTLKTYRQVK